MKRYKYAVLKYYNSVVSEECLCIGVLFQDVATGERIFNPIKNFKRLEVFDDEIDIEFFRYYLQSIKEEVELNIFNYQKGFDIEQYIKTYVNEIRFSNIYVSDTEDKNFIENTTKLFLKFDYHKRERLNKDTEKKYIRDILKSKKIKYSTVPVIGSRNEEIKFDYQIGDYAIKVFSFKDKELVRLISTAKTWAYNAMELKDKKKAIFVYDYDEDIIQSKEFKIIIDILKEYSYKTLSHEAGMEFILNLNL